MAKSTFFPGVKNTRVYFDVEEFIAHYERVSGEPVGEVMSETFRTFAEAINGAYEDGYRDGQEASNGQKH